MPIEACNLLTYSHLPLKRPLLPKIGPFRVSRSGARGATEFEMLTCPRLPEPSRGEIAKWGSEVRVPLRLTTHSPTRDCQWALSAPWHPKPNGQSSPLPRLFRGLGRASRGNLWHGDSASRVAAVL